MNNKSLYLLLVAVIAVGCSNQNYSAATTQDSAPTPELAASSRTTLENSSTVDQDSTAALEAIWRERTTGPDSSATGFALGPGDVLRISVPMIKELTDRTVRVSEDNTIALPLLGTIKVAGMTEQDLRQELASRLARYMYNPQVEVYLQTPENRVVSVLGSVKAPGRYLVASRSDTVMTLLSRAGGTTDTAGSQILFFPAPKRVGPGGGLGNSRHRVPTDQGTAQGRPGSSGANEGDLPAYAMVQSSQDLPLVISTAGPERYMEMPVHPGDVLFVPAAGSVSVQGWVDKPGIFPITPGMTALGSVAAAGGALFSSSATLVRAEPGGHREQIALNLARIKRGQEPDVPVRGGDVIIVERSAAGAIPYSLYFLASKIGLGVPIIP